MRSGVLQAIALANVALRYAAAGKRCGKAKRSTDDSARDRETAVLREIVDILQRRYGGLEPHRRPHYSPTARMRILELQAWQGWSQKKTAEIFQITEPTVASWIARLDEQGPAALVRTTEPVNKFPLLVDYLVKRLKTIYPALGKKKLAAILARAGLHLGATTVARLLKAKGPPEPQATTVTDEADETGGAVKADRPDDVWHVDLTVMPAGGGFWTPWLPFALPQRLPFGWWIVAVVDGYSRRVLHLACYAEQPTSRLVQTLLERTIREADAKPRSIVCDRGKQFDYERFRAWCRRRKIGVRYGAVGKHGSIALIERFIRTLKEYCRKLPVVPRERTSFTRELRAFQIWFNEHRPHEALGGKTPNEAYENRFPSIRRPRHEPRARWLRGSPCAQPWALPRGSPGAELALEIEHYAGRAHLPIVRLRRVA